MKGLQQCRSPALTQLLKMSFKEKPLWELPKWKGRQPRVVSLLPASADEWEAGEGGQLFEGNAIFHFLTTQIRQEEKTLAVFRYLMALRSNHQRKTICLLGQSLGKQEEAADKGIWCLPRAAEPQRTKISTGDGLTYKEKEMVTRGKAVQKPQEIWVPQVYFLQQCALP